jgi:hypothetical protein
MVIQYVKSKQVKTTGAGADSTKAAPAAMDSSVAKK